jgi:hypothetical protein
MKKFMWSKNFGPFLAQKAKQFRKHLTFIGRKVRKVLKFIQINAQKHYNLKVTYLKENVVLKSA